MATFSIVTTDNKKYCSILTGMRYDSDSNSLIFYNAQGEATNFSFDSNIKSVEIGLKTGNNYQYIQLNKYSSYIDYYDNLSYQRDRYNNLNTVYDLIHRYYKYV